MNLLERRARQNRKYHGEIGLPWFDTWTIPPSTATSPSPAPSTSNTRHYFDSISSIVSQVISGWSKNPTNQVYQGVGVIQNPAVQIAQSQAQQYQYAQQQGAPPPQNRGIAEDAAGGIMAFISAYPIPIALGVLGVVLLMREPPKRR